MGSNCSNCLHIAGSACRSKELKVNTIFLVIQFWVLFLYLECEPDPRFSELVDGNITAGLLIIKIKITTLEITWNDFQKIEMRVGTILEVKEFPEARKPAFQLLINFGNEIGLRKTSAQITTQYAKDDLVGKQVIAVVNFPKKQIANFMSECLVLGSVDGEDVILLTSDKLVKNGLKIG